MQSKLPAVVTALVFLAPHSASGQGPGGQGFRGGGPGGPGGPNAPDIELVDQFDADKNGRLNTAERRNALKHLQEQSQGRRSGRPGRRRPGRGGSGVSGSPGPRVSVRSVKAVDGTDLYDPTVLRTIFLQFESDDWEAELTAFKPTDVEVPAEMIVDGKAYAEVGVSFRGSSSFFTIPTGSKRSFNISMDFADGKQRLYGIKTLNLLNCNGDPSMMSSLLYHDIASKKIATPRVNFVKVVVNGRSWGIYANVEQFNKDFLKRNFDSKKGARWKVSGNPNADGGLRYFENDLEAYKSRFTLKSKEDPKAWSDLVELSRVINETPAENLEKALDPILDVDGTLWFLALDVAAANSDGYWTRASDYSVYQNTMGKFHILPHDMNEAFGLAGHGGPGDPGGRRGGPPGFGPPGGGFGPPGGGGGFGPPGFSPPGFGPPEGNRQRGGNQQRGGQRPGDDQRRVERENRGTDDRFGGGGQGFRGGRRGGPGGGMGHGGPELDPMVGMRNDRFPLRSKLLANDNLKRRYLQHVRTIATDYLNWDYLGPKVAASRKLIAKEVKADTRRLMTYEAFETATDNRKGSIRTFCTQRAEYLLKYPAIKNLKPSDE